MASTTAALGIEAESPYEAWTHRAVTPAEARILELVALGLSSREIADRMAVTRQAVTWHIGNLFMKLGADNRAGLVARAYATGLILGGCWPPRIGTEVRLLISVDSNAEDGSAGQEPVLSGSRPMDSHISAAVLESS